MTLALPVGPRTISYCMRGGDLVASYPVSRRITLLCFKFVCVLVSLLVVNPALTRA